MDFYQRLSALFQHQLIEKTPGREGLRKATHDQLVETFADITTIIAPDTIVEIGAHEAQFSRSMKLKLPHTEIVAFEANPFVYEKYSTEYDFSALGVKYQFAAVSNKCGKIDFHLVQQIGKRTPKPQNKISGIRGRTDPDVQSQSVEIDAVTLDQFFNGSTSRFVLWIDVEGAQDEVIAGSDAVLKNTDAVFIEVEERIFWENQILHDQIIDKFEPYGLAPFLRDCESPHQWNVLFLRKSLIETANVNRRVTEFVEFVEGEIKNAVENNPSVDS